MDRPVSVGIALAAPLRAAGAVLAIITAFSTPAASSEDPAPGTLTISSWPGYFPPDLLERFTTATGISAELNERAGDADKSEELTSTDADVLILSAPSVQALASREALAKLDHAKLPNLKNLYPEATKLAHDKGNQFSIPYTWGTVGICYRSDLVNEAPSSWGDLIKPRDELAGKVTMLPQERWLLAAGLKDLGFSANEVDPAKIMKAAKRLSDGKRGPAGYDGTAYFVRLGSGDIVMAQAWDSWCNYAIRSNAAVKYVIPREGSVLWVDTVAIANASDNKEAAHAFLNFILEPDIARSITEHSLYRSPNKAGMDRLDGALLAKYPGLSIKPEDLIKQEELLDVGKAMSDYSRAAADIINGK